MGNKRKSRANSAELTDSAVLAALTSMLRVRIPTMGGALGEPELAEHLSTQLHLDEGTGERAYWHAGYVSAMRDMLRMIEHRVDEYPMTDGDTHPSSSS